MESFAKFASDNIAVVGSSLVLVFLFLVFSWYRNRTSSEVTAIDDDLIFEETQSKTKKPAKARSRKVKSDKVSMKFYVAIAFCGSDSSMRDEPSNPRDEAMRDGIINLP
jgi:hypothetical protein